ncbi:MAG TPA: hypothetical protein PK079_08955 [Leptospiraceae bacterium]|nr:hypothetical protein [Leptospiraceae bacterium]HMX34313.1 hypothetical protein [Leptospiraceae bacterium]HMY31268.1 hypothetical protein [Leptospiraceae bacterium]HMZ63381.1 hypothetical protein [Leptospiraceae bacterium]HNA09203.1 hypothetical protein [Leptospiraceae bacterium]
MEFLEILSERLYKENDLSDFVWALFKSNTQFKNYFLNFIKCPDSSNGFEIEREYIFPNDNKRIDFYLYKGNKQKYFIENKIFDIGNYHFEEYSNLIDDPNSIKILISAHTIDNYNYKIGEKYGWTILYWKDFISSLEKEKLDPIILDFINYLKKVCMIKEIELIRFQANALKSIFYFNNLLDVIINCSNQEIYKCESYYKQSRAYENHYLGKYYTLKKHDKIFSYSAIGIIFNTENPICIWLDHDWNKTINDFLMKDKNNILDENYKIDNYAITFYMSQKEYESFVNSDKDNQFKVLQSFFVRVNNIIEKSYEGATSHRTTGA